MDSITTCRSTDLFSTAFSLLTAPPSLSLYKRLCVCVCLSDYNVLPFSCVSSSRHPTKTPGSGVVVVSLAVNFDDNDIVREWCRGLKINDFQDVQNQRWGQRGFIFYHFIHDICIHFIVCIIDWNTNHKFCFLLFSCFLIFNYNNKPTNWSLSSTSIHKVISYNCMNSWNFSYNLLNICDLIV